MVNKTEEYQYFTDSIQRTIIDLSPKSARRVLDVGGGNGAYADRIRARCGAQFCAIIDISHDAISNVRPTIDLAEVVDIENSEALAKFFEQHGPFDLILLLDVLEHLVDPWRVLSTLHGLMPDGGYILASIPNVQNYRVAIRAITGGWRYKDSGLFDRTHLRFFSRRSAQAMMTGTGLELVSTSRAFGPARQDKLASKLSLGLLDDLVTMQNLYLVQKVASEVIDPGDFGAKIAFS